MNCSVMDATSAGCKIEGSGRTGESDLSGFALEREIITTIISIPRAIIWRSPYLTREGERTGCA